MKTNSHKNLFSTSRAFGFVISIALLFAFSNSADPVPEIEVLSNNICNQDLLRAYSFKGTEIPIIEKIEMCPNIVRSCCLKEDQKVMYTNFIHGGEAQAIEDHYTKVLSVYADLLDTFVRSHELAKTITSNNKKTTSNCGLLTERVLSYEIPHVIELIRENMNKMKEMFKDAFAGVYCTICNFDNHKYFDTVKNKVYLSESFCRNLIEESLHVLLMMHVDIVKPANLVTKFVTSCDIRGEFKLDAVAPTNLTFTVEKSVVFELEGCARNRNKKEWFFHCKDICSNFRIGQYAEFFQPNLEQIASFTLFVDANINKITSAPSLKSMAGALAVPAALKPEKRRILQEVEDKGIFKVGLAAKTTLVKLQSVFQSEGISLHDEGENQMINEPTYHTVSTIIQILHSEIGLKKDQPEYLSENGTATNGTQNQNTQNSPRRARKLKSSFALNAFYGVWMIILVLVNRG